MGQAFNELSSVRVGWFPINNRTDVTMLDMDTHRNTLLDQLYDIIGNSGARRIGSRWTLPDSNTNARTGELRSQPPVKKTLPCNLPMVIQPSTARPL